MVYETGLLNTRQCEQFKGFLDNNIGTFYQENWDSFAKKYENKYLEVHELTRNEIVTIRDFETNLLKS